MGDELNVLRRGGRGAGPGACVFMLLKQFRSVLFRSGPSRPLHCFDHARSRCASSTPRVAINPDQLEPMQKMCRKV